jgi:predicted phosphodiesterase
MKGMDRREFVKLMGLGGAVLVSGLGGLGGLGRAMAAPAGGEDFFFVQLSDTHWGFSGPAVNPDPKGTLPKAIAAVNSLSRQPDFVVFTGDLSHNTEDVQERRKRLTEFKEIAATLKVKDVKFLAGEHDASLDNGQAFKELIGPTQYAFQHKGVHFIVLDNVSDPGASLGQAQLQWLEAELKKAGTQARIIVLTHRPLFDLYPQWDWATRDGAKAVELLMPYPNVTVLYGHIHQENHHMTGHIPHHAAMGLMIPLPAPGSVPKRVPIPWDPAAPYKGMGFRSVTGKSGQMTVDLTEYPLQKKG